MDHPSVNTSPYSSSLEDSSYSSGRDCPAVGMITPIESCESRLTTKNKKAACKHTSCPRFRPTVATIKPPPKVKKQKGRKINHVCVCCGKVGVLQGRGLITKCYDRFKFKKELDKFPKVYSPYVFTEEAT
jgi:hypothetical protein